MSYPVQLALLHWANPYPRFQGYVLPVAVSLGAARVSALLASILGAVWHAETRQIEIAPHGPSSCGIQALQL